MKKIFLWGTGKNCIKFLEYLPCERVEAFIETIPKNRTFREKPIIAANEVNIGENDILIITIQKPIEIIEKIQENPNIDMKRVILYDLSGIQNNIFWAVRQTILEDYLPNAAYLQLLKNNSIDSLLFNAEFVRYICEMEGLEFPKQCECKGYMKPYNKDINMNSRIGRLLKICGY